MNSLHVRRVGVRSYLLSLRDLSFRYNHKVRTYVEYRAVSGVLQKLTCRYMYVAISAVKGRRECRLTYCTIPYLGSI
jgi:hypothetical protein